MSRGEYPTDISFKPIPISKIPNGKSKETVNEVVNNVSSVLGGKRWLQEIALVESQNGENPKTYREGYHGGIWQVDPVGFEQTRNNPKLKEAYERIRQNFGVDYNSLKYEDLRKPIYSGLAARLYLMDRVGDKEPPTVTDRARLWKIHYNTNAGKGTVPMYVRKVRSSVFDDE